MHAPARGEARPSLGPPGLTWLASYPKSGNTWLRILLSNFHAGTATPEDINRLTLKSVLAESREEFSVRTLLDSRLLSPREIEPLLAALYENWARESPEPLFLKTHSAFTRFEDGAPVRGATARRAVYIVRDPRDVVISHACHFGLDCDASIRILNDAQAWLGNDSEQMRQPLLDWSGHVRSWADQTDVPVIVVRYEDMLQSPVETFERVLGFLDAVGDRASVERAVRHADFSELKGQERRAGFVDRGEASKEFFRNGQAGQWRERLTGLQVRNIEARHGETMERFGYRLESRFPAAAPGTAS